MSQSQNSLHEKLLEKLQTVKSDEPETGWLRDLVEWLYQEMMEMEFTDQLGAGHYERTATRQGYRNGYRERQLNTRVGTLTLRVPRDREGKFSTRLFERCQRLEKALILALQEAYVAGVSTRKVSRITREALRNRVLQGSGVEDGPSVGWTTRSMARETIEKRLPVPGC